MNFKIVYQSKRSIMVNSDIKRLIFSVQSRIEGVFPHILIEVLARPTHIRIIVNKFITECSIDSQRSIETVISSGHYLCTFNLDYPTLLLNIIIDSVELFAILNMALNSFS